MAILLLIQEHCEKRQQGSVTRLQLSPVFLNLNALEIWCNLSILSSKVCAVHHGTTTGRG
eukprot:8270019-Karenia_brevis.AAC.1